MPRYSDAEVERQERFRRYTTASAEISLRAHREAQRAGVPESRTVESRTSDWLLALVMDPEVLSELLAARDIDIAAVRRRRSINSANTRVTSSDEPDRRPIHGTTSQQLHGVFESLMKWALSEQPDEEVGNWPPHSDLRMFMSTIPPDAEDDPWPPERVRARVFRLAVIRRTFELLLEHDEDGTRRALDDLGLSELDFQRCLDTLARRYTLDFVYRSPD
jgi:hypothetical protein